MFCFVDFYFIFIVPCSDIEGTQYWHSSKSENVRFFNELVAGAHARGIKLGVYCSHSQWEALLGNYQFGYASSTPLWYAHYDGRPEFNDFHAFGGW